MPILFLLLFKFSILLSLRSRGRLSARSTMSLLKDLMTMSGTRTIPDVLFDIFIMLFLVLQNLCSFPYYYNEFIYKDPTVRFEYGFTYIIFIKSFL